MADRRQTFTPEFRAEAVRLEQTSGRSRREVAAELGVGLSTLRNWIDGRREREMDHHADEGDKVQACQGAGVAFVIFDEPAETRGSG